MQRAKANVYVLELSLSESERLVARHSLILADSRQEDGNVLLSLANTRQASQSEQA
ncbi:hypothetical protein A2U01_0107627 [Trifolium medium]|uniref:Uncharacterized protein n=1 Tax=Trifolium medium TaxID=97028 RepID=A0A392VDA2_9FABA|nr:hypothetical protein [Trifolium medium]